MPFKSIFSNSGRKPFFYRWKIPGYWFKKNLDDAINFRIELSGINPTRLEWWTFQIKKPFAILFNFGDWTPSFKKFLKKNQFIFEKTKK